ncbi:MAG: SDR family NAD(P)-dependent oxidoreductase, partial [Spirochaetales bacterium]|nr:SDR family NAD(P)-dependent oxidoreductase [Spirochaetales bacterium]
MMILVTGGAGFIGSHACVELINAGYDVVVVDKLVNSHEKSIDRVMKITGKRPEFVNEDVCDEKALDAVFSKYQIDSVIHFAGLKAVGESVQKPLEYFSNNLDASMVLCKIMREHGVHNLVFSSSATVYS